MAAFPIPYSVVNKVNHIELSEGKPFLLTFYYRKGNPVVDDDTNIAVVDEEPEITGVYEDTDEQDKYCIKNEEPQYRYDTTYIYINQDDHKHNQEFHKE